MKRSFSANQFSAPARDASSLNRACAIQSANVVETVTQTYPDDPDVPNVRYSFSDALERVMVENGISAFVHPENTVPTPRIQGPNVGDISLDGITPFFQIPRVVIPAGLNDIVVEPQYVLNADKTDYIPTIAPSTPKTRLPHPMPVAITLFAGQGDEPTLIKIGTAYETATHHRTSPPAFGPVVARPVTTTSSR